MKLLHKFITLLILTVSTLSYPAYSFAEYEQFIEKVHYTHPNRANGENSIEAKKEIGSEDAEVEVHIWGMLGEKFTQKFFTEIFSDLQTNYPQTKFIFNHRTFPFHGSKGEQLALLTECTAAQGVFWQNIPNLITNANSPTRTNNITAINETRLKNCLKNPATKSVITTANDDAEIFGITSIPTVIISSTQNTKLHDIKVVGSQELSVYDYAISEAIGSSSATISTTEVTELKNQLNNLNNQLAITQAELHAIKEENSSIQTQVDKLIGLVESVLHFLELR